MSEPKTTEVEVCPDCKGRGRTMRLVSYDGKMISEHCWTCSGTGQIKDSEQ